MIEIFIRNKKVLLSLFSFLVIGAFSAPSVFAVWSGTFYSAGETLNPECAPTDIDCDVLPPMALKETGAGTDIVTIQAPAAIGTSFTLTLPTDDGTASQYLQTDGNGNLTWATISAGLVTGTTAITSGTDTRVFFNDGGVLGEDAGFTYDKTTDSLTVTGSQIVPLISGSTSVNGDITINGTTSATKTTSYVILQETGGNVGIGTTSPLTSLDVTSAGAALGGTGFYNTAALQDHTNYRGFLMGYDTSGQIGVIAAGSNGSTKSTTAFWNNNGSAFVERMRITGDGLVSIGTSANITGTTKALVVNNGTSTGNIFEAQDNGTAVFTVADGGNVGIGTAAPGALLEVNKSQNAETSIYLLNASTGAAASESILVGEATSGLKYTYFAYFNNSFKHMLYYIDKFIILSKKCSTIHHLC